MQIRGRDREIAPTEEGVGFYQIRGRDREIAPTEEGVGLLSNSEVSDRDDRSYRIEGVGFYQIRGRESGDRSYKKRG